MIVCINCNAATKATMDSLLYEGHYRDYSELIEIAVENLRILNREVSEKGDLVIGQDSAPRYVPGGLPLAEGAMQINDRKRKPVTVGIPELFLSRGLDELSVVTIEATPTEYTEKIFTLDRWLFGQYNKLLPAKVNCRALVRLTAGKENGVPLDTAAAQIAEAAALLGDYMADHDRRHQIGRDDALATAFPRSGHDAEKSRVRYANQFIGSVNTQNALSGLLWDYHLAGLASENGLFLLPTEQAIQLSRLKNPILDDCQTGPAQKFSEEERAFLLEHIRSSVPVEAFAFITLIQAIINGADTPNKLNEALHELVPSDSNRALSPSFLTSQRSGALSRMSDLCLIARVRRGVKVTYTITQDGEAFLAKTGNKENTSL